MTPTPQLKRKAIDKIGNRCRECGSPNIEFAHVKPTKLKGRGRGSRNRYCDVIRNHDCYAPLCKSCHIAFDNQGQQID